MGNNKCASCTAKCFTFLFALLLFAAGIILLGVGIFAATRLSAYIPVGPTPWIMIGIGVLVLFLSTAGFSILCCPRRRRCSLATMMVLTLLCFAMSAAATGLGFEYNKIMSTAFKSGFADTGLSTLEKSFYHGMRDTFQDLYADCKPTSYKSTDVQSECVSFKDDARVDVEECSSAGYPVGRVGIFCKKGPGLDDFTVDKGVAYPAPDDSLSIEDFINKRSFGYFSNYACMPTLGEYLDARLEMSRLDAGAQPNTTFGSCYSSTWWGEVGNVAAAPGFVEQPNGDPLSAGQTSFFDALQSKGSVAMNDKMVFCFCSDEGKESKLYQFIVKISSYGKWIALGASFFFLFVFIAECYLCCCYRDRSDAVMGKQLTVLRP